jgi:hypothetical protein
MKRVLFGTLAVVLTANAMCAYFWVQVNAATTSSPGRDFTVVDESLENRLYGSKAPLYEKPFVPEWTKNEAIQEGTKALDALGSRLKIKLATEVGARYDQHPLNGKYQPGIWMLHWCRVDDQGNPFRDDGVTMEIPESYHPLWVKVEQSSAYAEVSGAPFSRKDAFAKIKSKIESQESWDGFESKIEPWRQAYGWTDTSNYSESLIIVHPNHDMAAPARLAWDFWFYHHPEGTIADPPHAPFHYHFAVEYWLDAHTGSIIGEDEGGMDMPD